MGEEETYDGIAIADLRVDSVRWTPEQAEHVRTRSSRSKAAGRVLTVILFPEEHPPTGSWLGVTAWVTKGRDLRDYETHESGQHEEDQGQAAAEKGGTGQ